LRCCEGVVAGLQLTLSRTNYCRTWCRYRIIPITRLCHEHCRCSRASSLLVNRRLPSRTSFHVSRPKTCWIGGRSRSNLMPLAPHESPYPWTTMWPYVVYREQAFDPARSCLSAYVNAPTSRTPDNSQYRFSRSHKLRDR
jgi:hypothetical protein